MSRTAVSTDLQREWNVLKARRNPHLEDKSEVLDSRDRIQRLRIKSEQKGFNDDEVVIQGTCLEMCPEKERYERLKQNRVDTWEENGHFIKDFSRQAADQDMPLPSELRTEATLRSTMDYLLREIISRPPENPENPAGWYDFVWRRLRAIRKEITQQRLTGAVIASILEDMCRFHLVSCHTFCEADHNQFDQKFNLEAVNDCLATLSRIYAEMEEEKIYSENIAEMRSYEMLLRIWTDKLDLVKITSLMLQLPEHIQAQSELAFARKVVSACNSRLYSEYISLLRQADYVTACLMHYYLPMVQARTLHHLAVSSGGRSKGSTSLPVEFVQSTFGLNTQEELQIFCAHHGLESKEGEPSMVSFNAGSVGRRDPKTYPRVRSIEYVDSKVGARNMAEIIARKQFIEIAVPRIVEVHSFDENDVYSGEDPWSSRISNIENIPPPKNTQPVGFFQNLYQAKKAAAVLPSQAPTSAFTFKTPSSTTVISTFQPPSPQKSAPSFASPVSPSSSAGLSRFSLKRSLSRAERTADEDVVYLGSKRPHGESSPGVSSSPLRIPSDPAEPTSENTPMPPSPVKRSPSKVPQEMADEKTEGEVGKDYPVRTHLKLIRARAVCHAGGTLNAVFKAWRNYSHSIRQPTHYFGRIDADPDQVEQAETLQQEEVNNWLWAKFPFRSYLNKTLDFDVCVLLFLYIDSQTRRRDRVSLWLRTKLGDPSPEDNESSVRVLTFTEGRKELCVVFVNVLADLQSAHSAVTDLRDSVGALCMYCAAKSDLAVAESFRDDLSDRTVQVLPSAVFCPEENLSEEELEGLPGNIILNVGLKSDQPSLELSFALWDSIKLLLMRRINASIRQSLTLLQIVSRLYCDFVKMHRALQTELRDELSSGKLVQLWNTMVDTYLEDRQFVLDKERMCDWLLEKLPENQLYWLLKISDDDDTWSSNNSPVEVFPVGGIVELTTGSQKTRNLFAAVAQKLTIVTAAASVYDPVTRPGSSSEPLPDFELLLKNYLEEFDMASGSGSSSESSGDDEADLGSSRKNIQLSKRPSSHTISSRNTRRNVESITDAFRTVRQTRNDLSEWFTGLSSLLSDLDSL